MSKPLAACAAALILASGMDVRAEPSARDVAAEQLFRAGRDLLAQRHFKEACEKLDASEKLAPAVGTLFSLGECYAAQGRTASAWFAYRTATALANQRSDPRLGAAEGRVAAIEPQLSTIAIHARADVRVEIDGEVFGSEVLRAPMPIDPGSHQVDVAAPGFVTWSRIVFVRGPSDVATVDVPPLQRLPDAAELARARDRVAARRALGLGVVATGLLAVGAGAILGMHAIVEGRDATHECPRASACSDAAAVREGNDAKTYADASTVALPVGAALVAVGAYLFFRANTLPDFVTGRVSSNGGAAEVQWSW